MRVMNILQCSRHILQFDCQHRLRHQHHLGSRLLSTLLASHLSQRQVIHVKGPEGRQYLQGLLTNDIQHLEDNHGNFLYSFILTPNGRVLSDVMVYRHELDSLYLECDVRIASQVLKHLMVHKLRKKLTISIQEKSLVFALFPETLSSSDSKVKVSEFQGQNCILSNDTRLPISIFRVLSTDASDVDLTQIMKRGLKQEIKILMKPETDYQSFCHRLGLGEGFSDHPPGCLPLESNGDITHGISFFKGCYVGQELTARTYHTGIIRKRLMPITFSTPTDQQDLDLKSTDGKTRLGKLRSSSGSNGLGLLYVDNVVKNGLELYSAEGEKNGTTEIPFWWPQKLRPPA